MKTKLLSRLQHLEARTQQARRSTLRLGRLRGLPSDYVGERHVAMVKNVPDTPPDFFEFEERPGPAPHGSKQNDIPTLYLSEDDLNL